MACLYRARMIIWARSERRQGQVTTFRNLTFKTLGSLLIRKRHRISANDAPHMIFARNTSQVFYASELSLARTTLRVSSTNKMNGSSQSGPIFDSIILDLLCLFFFRVRYFLADFIQLHEMRSHCHNWANWSPIPRWTPRVRYSMSHYSFGRDLPPRSKGKMHILQETYSVMWMKNSFTIHLFTCFNWLSKLKMIKV